MKRHFIWIGVLFLALATITTSCKKKNYVEVSKEVITFTYAGGTDVFRIESDCDWTIERDNSQTWYSISKESGHGNDTIVVNVDKNLLSYDNTAWLTISPTNRKRDKKVAIVQTKIAIIDIIRKIWFTRFYERWDTDYYNQVIVESYRDYTYYSNEGFENWFFYFLEDNTGYEIRTENGDTIYYPFDFIYYPDGDSLYINFMMIDTTIKEDYHTTIQELNSERLVITNEYRPHQFEKITAYNATAPEESKRTELKINPKKVRGKTPGPIIQIPK